MTTEKDKPISRMEMVFATCVRAVDSFGEESPTSSIHAAASASTSGVLAPEKFVAETEDIDDALLPPYVCASDALSRGELSCGNSVLVAGKFFVIFKGPRGCPKHQHGSSQI